MTLPDLDEYIAMEEKKNSTDITKSVRKVIIQACRDNRLLCGVVDCATQLQMDPDTIAMCILQEIESETVSTHMQHTLMNAYCRENGIPVLKVIPQSSLSDLYCLMEKSSSNAYAKISSSNNPVINNGHALLERKRSNTYDFSCILIKHSDVISAEEKMLKDFCEDLDEIDHHS